MAKTLLHVKPGESDNRESGDENLEREKEKLLENLKFVRIALRSKSQCTSDRVKPTSISESNGADIIEKQFPDGDLYRGTFANNTPHGSGKYLWGDGCMYEGEWKKGERSGKGKFWWPSGATFEGEFKSGRVEGTGTFVGTDGDMYRGSWSGNRKHGYGVQHYSNGDYYEGLWRRNMWYGQGRYLWRDGHEYVGEWKNGTIHGRGVWLWNNGKRYHGDFENGVPRGSGLVTWPDGSRYICCWSNDPCNNGKRILSGTFYPAHDAKTHILPAALNGTEGGFKMIYHISGLFEIDYIVIWLEDYGAMKVRSSSAYVWFSQKFDPISYQENEGYSEGVVDAINRLIEGNDAHIKSLHISAVSELSKTLRDGLKMSNVVCSDNITSRSSEYCGNGTKGLLTPLLKGPTWDPSGGFHLENVSWFEGRSCLDENKDDMKGKVVMNEKNSVMSECFLLKMSSNDDDSSSISPNGKFRRVIEGWQKGDLLGCGSFGSVYEGIADNGFFFAVKEVSLLDEGDHGKQRIIQLEREIDLLSQFEHENIVQYYGTEKDESHLYIILELVPKGSLRSLYQKYELQPPQVSAYTRQILEGLKYLHDRYVVHRDIKCANILVHTNAVVKLADFGLAKVTKLNDVMSCKGTWRWMAPEVVQSQGYGLPADIWSLGCTVLEMLTGCPPYSDFEEAAAALFRIGRGEGPSIPEYLPNDAQDFMLECLQVDPSLRPTANQLLYHPFVKKPRQSFPGTKSSQLPQQI